MLLLMMMMIKLLKLRDRPVSSLQVQCQRVHEVLLQTSFCQDVVLDAEHHHAGTKALYNNIIIIIIIVIVVVVVVVVVVS